MVAEDGGAPAGWYPDPLGLPQLRWWDGGAWTEFTTPGDATPAAAEAEDAAETEGSDEAADGIVHVIDLDDVALEDDALDDVAFEDDDTVVVPRAESFEEQLAASESEGARGRGIGGESEFESESESEPESESASAPEPGPELSPLPEPEPVPEPEPQPAPTPEPEPEPSDEPAGALAVVPEPFDPASADPFAAATARSVAFTSRRARRAYERKLALEAGGADIAAPPYADLDTNPVDIQLASSRTGVTPSAVLDESSAASPFVPPAMPVAPATPVAADPAAPTAGTPTDGREDILAQSALAPRDPAEPAFSLESTDVADELPPARTLIPKRTVGAVAYVLAMLPPLALLAIVALREVPGLTVTPMLAAGVGGAAYVIGLLLAVLDAGALRRWGHERTASPLWALLTPIVYLTVRSVATRRETGRDGGVVLAWILGLALAAAIVVLIPDLVSLLVPGVTAPWNSPLG